MTRNAQDTKKNFFSNFRNVFLISLVVFVACLGATQWVIKQMSHKDVDYGLRLFQEDWNRRIDRNAAAIKNTFDLVYNSTRTIAMIPGIQRIDPQGSNLEGDTIVTTQQIYHNLFASFSASKIYIVPENLDPDNPSAAQKPIITFDDFLTQKTKESPENNSENLGTQEYREMKKQLTYFKRYFPAMNSFTGFNYPAAFSDEIMTSDVTDLNSEEGSQGGRKGYVYSVPFYAPDGQLKGMICVIFKTKVFSKLLDEPFFILSSGENKSIVHINPPKAISSEIMSILGEIDQESYAFFKSVEVTIKDEKKWKLFAAVPQETWKESSIYKSINLNARWIWMIGILLSFSFAMLAWVLMYSRTRALNLLNQMRSSLESAQRQLFQNQKSDLVTKVSREMANDFQNNITPILAYTHLLISKLPANSPELRQAEVIKKSAEKATQVIQQLQILSKTQVANKQKINLAPILTKVHTTLQQTLHGKAEVKLEMASDLWEISGDANQLETVLMNLGFNARDAMPEGGTLQITASNKTEDKSGNNDIQQLALGYYLKIQVTDTGKGMPEEIINKIFDPALKDNKKSNDTGDVKLYKLHAIITDHKGIILVESEIGQGTTFSIYLPALVDKPLPQVEAKPSEPAPTPTQTEAQPETPKSETPTDTAPEPTPPSPSEAVPAEASTTPPPAPAESPSETPTEQAPETTNTTSASEAVPEVVTAPTPEATPAPVLETTPPAVAEVIAETPAATTTETPPEPAPTPSSEATASTEAATPSDTQAAPTDPNLTS